MLLKRGASLTQKDYKGNTPLHGVCSLGLIDMASMLIEHGSNLTDTDVEGFCPIDLAIRFQHSHLATELIKKFVCVGEKCLKAPTSQCSRCMRAFYCSKNCQVANLHIHKKSCRKIYC